ncbi:MAG: redoxin domain-containing protein [Actinobacteria bacterium]|nr:redoxin domain-containing protein [Actinomycetota bacterium]
MADLVLVARLVLIGVFATAGLSKLIDRVGSRTALGEFGVPPGAAPALAKALPLVEMTVAVALVAPMSAVAGAVGALLLLAAFSVVIAANLARGRRPNCHCFGQLHSSPVGPWTLARNVVLVGIAAFVLWGGPGPSLSHAAAWLPSGRGAAAVSLIAFVLLTGGLGVVGWFVMNLVEQRGRLLMRLDTIEAALADHGLLAPPATSARSSDLPVGSPAPDFVVRAANGVELTRDSLLEHGKPALLVFSDPDCGPCRELLPEIADWVSNGSAGPSIALITRGGKRDRWLQEAEGALGLENVLYQKEREVADAYQVFGTPAAVVVGTNGTIASPVAVGANEIRDLWTRTSQGVPVRFRPGNGIPDPVRTTERPVVGKGEAAPSMTLGDPSGRTVNLEDLYRGETVVLFWDPACGFCQQLLSAVQGWERNRPADAPDLIVISRGTPAVNEAMGFRCPILLDDSFSAARAFGAYGTPSAVLVDERGRLASDVRSGGPAVLELLNAAAG